MRLIDADALKKAIENYLANRQDILIWESDMFNMLDNAPTIKTFTLEDIEENYRKGLEKGLSECAKMEEE